MEWFVVTEDAQEDFAAAFSTRGRVGLVKNCGLFRLRSFSRTLTLLRKKKYNSCAGDSK